MKEFSEILDGPISHENNMWWLFRESVSLSYIPPEITVHNKEFMENYIKNKNV